MDTRLHVTGIGDGITATASLVEHKELQSPALREATAPGRLAAYIGKVSLSPTLEHPARLEILAAPDAGWIAIAWTTPTRFAKIDGEEDILPALTDWLIDWPAWNDRVDALGTVREARS